MSNTNRKAKRKLKGASPSKRKAKGSKNSEADCLICEEAILEPSDTYVGDEAVFCEGSCQGWLHRKCASITCLAFDKLGEQDTEYMCSYCMLESQGKEISKLSNVIQDLNTAIVSLTKTIQLLQSSVSKQSTTTDQPSNTTADIASTKKTFQEKPQQDQKFNVVIFSIDECPKGTPSQALTSVVLLELLLKSMRILTRYQFMTFIDLVNTKKSLHVLDLS